MEYREFFQKMQKHMVFHADGAGDWWMNLINADGAHLDFEFAIPARTVEPDDVNTLCGWKITDSEGFYFNGKPRYLVVFGDTPWQKVDEIIQLFIDAPAEACAEYDVFVNSSVLY